MGPEKCQKKCHVLFKWPLTRHLTMITKFEVKKELLVTFHSISEIRQCWLKLTSGLTHFALMKHFDATCCCCISLQSYFCLILLKIALGTFVAKAMHKIVSDFDRNYIRRPQIKCATHGEASPSQLLRNLVCNQGYLVWPVPPSRTQVLN